MRQIVVLFLLLTTVYSKAQTTFQKVIHKPGSPRDFAQAIQQMPDSGYILLERTGTTLATGATVLIRTNKNGFILWSKEYTTLNSSQCYDLKITADGGFAFFGNILRRDTNIGFIFKTDTVGNFLWSKTFGLDNYIYSGEVTNDGGYIVTGKTRVYGQGGESHAPATPGKTASDVYLVKLNNTGSVQWAKTFGIKGGEDAGYAVIQSSDGGYVVAGEIADTVISKSYYYPQGYLIKTNSTGAFQWSKTFTNNYTGASYRDNYPQLKLKAIQETSDKGFILSGELQDGYEKPVRLIKTNNTGDVEWEHYYRSNTKQPNIEGLYEIKNVYQTSDGGFIIGTEANQETYCFNFATDTTVWLQPGTTNFQGGIKSLYLIKVNSVGSLLWSRYSANYISPNTSSLFSLPKLIPSLDGGYTSFGTLYDTLEYKWKCFIVKTDMEGKVGGCENTPITSVHSLSIAVSNSGVAGVGGGVSTFTTAVDPSLFTATSVCMKMPVLSRFCATAACVGDSVYFGNISTGSLANWNFGDPSSGTKNNATGYFYFYDFSGNYAPKKGYGNWAAHYYPAVGTYTVTLIATDGSGTPSDTSQQIIHILPNKFLTVGSDITICSGDSTTLSASGNYVNFIQWTNNHSLNDTLLANPVASPTTTTTYIATASNIGCNDVDTIIVKVNAMPTIYVGSNSTICSGEDIVLTAYADISTFIQWSSNNSLSNPLLLNPTASPTVTSTFIALASNNGCNNADTVVVKVNLLPVIDAGSNITISSTSNITLKASGALSYLWSSEDALSCSNCNNPTITSKQTSIYYVTGIDSNGCKNYDSVIVSIINCSEDILVPNAFSPNGDGLNDSLVININSCTQSFLFAIYNRWGEKIVNYEREKEDGINRISVWDGTYKGKKLDNGVFVYSFEVITKNGDTISKKGNISLIK